MRTLLLCGCIWPLRELSKLGLDLRSVPGELKLIEEIISSGQADDTEGRRISNWVDYAFYTQKTMLQAIRSDGALTQQNSVSQESDLDRLVASLPNPDREAIAAALEPLRGKGQSSLRCQEESRSKIEV